MGAGLSIWSKSVKDHEDVFLDIVKAAYRSRCKMYLHSVDEYYVGESKLLKPNSFTLEKETLENTAMIFHISTYEEQIPLLQEYQSFYNQSGDQVKVDGAINLVASEDVDTELAFCFSYHYLNLNRDHYIDIDFLIDWELMQELHLNGYDETWCWRKR